ncbi:MAG TPA: M24 family metallopeptidase, partial [Aigarchaeota archaeon]|nr:M24 family metallopeptidase [Aigarchaeota archaeon]
GADAIPETPVITPGREVYRRGDTLTLTVTASKKGYAAKLTRTMTVGHEEGGEAARLCDTLVEWFSECSEKVKAWSPTLELFDMLREKLNPLGGARVSRVIGHGIGLELVEPPSITPNSKELLPEGAVITLQPKLLVKSSTILSIGDTYAVERDGLVKLSRIDYIL